MGARILGISFNTPEQNRAWSEMIGFEFPLLSDPEQTAAKAMGAVRDPDDRLAGLPRRITYLVDPDGVVRRAYRVQRDELIIHPRQVMDDLSQLIG